jgi:hypothetical protein
MYDLIFTINLLLYASMIYVANTEPNFKFVITQHNTCLETNTLNVIRTFARISLAECITECGTRPECEAINYRRRYKICELISSEIGDLVMINGQTGPCVLVLKSDISEVRFDLHYIILHYVKACSLCLVIPFKCITILCSVCINMIITWHKHTSLFFFCRKLSDIYYYLKHFVHYLKSLIKVSGIRFSTDTGGEGFQIIVKQQWPNLIVFWL